MTTAQDEARGINVGPLEFDHPQMIRARRLWADLLRREGVLEEGDLELVMFMQHDHIRDRLMADVVNPYAWDEEDYNAIFRGGVKPDGEMVSRMRAATEACRNLSELSETLDHPPMLMICAMCQWLVLNASIAGMGAKIALEINPEYHLARLMLSMVTRGLNPDWALRQ